MSGTITSEVLPLVSSNDPILRTSPEKFDFSNPPVDPVFLARQLADAMVAYNGYGLSACQIGLPHNVFVMGKAGAEVYACFNPRIVSASPETVKIKEGCLSFPGLILEIERPSVVRMRYTQPNGQTVTRELAGFTARVAQHEYDHLQGKLFIDGFSRLSLNMAKRKANKKIGRKIYWV
jgi:peptide deformylase